VVTVLVVGAVVEVSARKRQRARMAREAQKAGEVGEAQKYTDSP